MTGKAINNGKVFAWRNALRVFRDACAVTRHGSKDTAFPLVFSADEELGKAALADRQLDRFGLNLDSEQYAAEDLKYLSHKHRTQAGMGADRI